MITSAYHTMNGNSKKKWNQVWKYINSINEAYQYPKLIYMDINSDINTQEFKEFERKMVIKG